MAELIDKAQLGPDQRAELYEGGKILIIDDSTDPFLQGIITLEALPATKLYDFLLLHMSRLARHRDAQKVQAYNAEMDARNRIIAENREKPWLPLVDGE